MRFSLRLDAPSAQVGATLGGCAALVAATLALIAQSTRLVTTCGDSFSSIPSLILLVVTVLVLSSSAGFIAWLVASFDNTLARSVVISLTAVALVAITVFAGYIGIIAGVVGFDSGHHVSPRNFPIVAAALGGPGVVAFVACALPHARPASAVNPFLVGWMSTLALLVAHAGAVLLAAASMCG